MMPNLIVRFAKNFGESFINFHGGKGWEAQGKGMGVYTGKEASAGVVEAIGFHRGKHLHGGRRKYS